MSPTNLETRVHDLFARQAAALTPPDVLPDEVRVILGDPSQDRRPRGRVLAIAAAAALLVVGGMVVANRHAETDFASGSDTSDGFHVATAQVTLDAASIEVDAGGRTFIPPATVEVNSDPGVMNEYTTLELSWDADGTPMKINIYFASDGIEWWATEIRTYDGTRDDKWIEMHGEYFRTPLGSAYQGDVDVSSLHIHGLRLQAFLKPAACTSLDKPLALVSDYAKIETLPKGVEGLDGYAATVKLIDTATCLPVSTSAMNISITSADTNVAVVQPTLTTVDVAPGVIRIELELPNAGTTTVRVAVSDPITGQLIDAIDIPVIVHPAP